MVCCDVGGGGAELFSEGSSTHCLDSFQGATCLTTCVKLDAGLNGPASLGVVIQQGTSYGLFVYANISYVFNN